MGPLEATGFFARTPIKTQLVGWGIILGPLLLLVVLGALFLRAEPIERTAVFGCYAAQGAPTLDILPDRIRIGGLGSQAFNYSVEPAKDGYRISVRPALELSPVSQGEYAFKAERGIGYFWPLLKADSDDPRDTRNPGDFGGRFRIIARDGAAIIYSRSADGRKCQ